MTELKINCLYGENCVVRPKVTQLTGLMDVEARIPDEILKAPDKKTADFLRSHLKDTQASVQKLKDEIKNAACDICLFKPFL